MDGGESQAARWHVCLRERLRLAGDCDCDTPSGRKRDQTWVGAGGRPGRGPEGLQTWMVQALLTNRPLFVPRPTGDTLQVTEPTKQKEGPGPPSLEEKLGVPVAREGGAEQEWDRETFSFLPFRPHWAPPGGCGPSGVGGEHRVPSSGAGAGGGQAHSTLGPLGGACTTVGCAGRRAG